MHRLGSAAPISGHGAVLHPLEPRRMMSAVVQHHELVIVGSRRNDAILVSDGAKGHVNVTVNRVAYRFLKAGFGGIRISAGLGNDLVTVSTSVPAVVTAGAGDDSIDGGSGDDRLSGDDGNDLIRGRGGDDAIAGGAGRDVLDGGDGNDQVSGDSGADNVFGGLGNDSLYGGRGNDLLHEDEGIDRIFGNAGVDSFTIRSSSRDVRDEVTGETIAAEGFVDFASASSGGVLIRTGSGTLRGGIATRT